MRQDPIHPERLSVVCHVRASLLFEPVDAKLRTVKRCDREHLIADAEVRSWPDEVPLSGTGCDEGIVRAYDRFAEWARHNEVDIHPPFDRRHSTTIGTEETRELLVTPVLLLALYEHDRLVGVFPHQDGELRRSAADAIAALRTGRGSALEQLLPTTALSVEDTSRRAAPTDDRPGRGDCPGCDGPLLNVQGLLACADCSWTAAGEYDGSSRHESPASSERPGPVHRA